jgi:class 3 adenylate cyclase
MPSWLGSRQRDLRTVLFTDIVGSTEEAARIGDRAWAAVLARHHSLVRAALRRTDGREEDTAGDGFFATFARPTDALACASEIERDVATLGLTVRVGLHAGEVEHQDGKAAGITVHVAARLMAAAGPGEVLASATVRELAAGAGWSFADRGLLELKGLAEPVHAYALDLGVAPPGAGTRTDGRRIATAPARAVLALTGLVMLVVVAVVGVRLLVGSAGPGASPSPVALGTTLPLGLASSPVSSLGASLSPDLLSPAPAQYELVPGLSVDIDPGWQETDFGLERQTSPEDRISIFTDFEPTNDPCGNNPGPSLGADPETQFVAWARANKGLSLRPPGGVLRHFGDLATTEFDVSVVPAFACSYTSPLSVALTPSNEHSVLDVGTRVRFEVSSLDDRIILFLIQAPSEAEFNVFDAEAEQVLSTLKIRQ